MLTDKPLSFITEFVETLNDAIGKHSPGSGLSSKQRYRIGFCMMAILMTNTICWAKFARANPGGYTIAALSWMFRHSGIPWEKLLCQSIGCVLSQYGITTGTLVVDDSEKKRSENTKRISNVHKIRDKKTDGYIMGQCIVFLIPVTPLITIPVGFMLYMPDPRLTEWYKLKKRSGKSGSCPKKPPKNTNYPTKQEIALILLKKFAAEHSHIRIKCILADNLYGCKTFFAGVGKSFGKIQMISQMKSNQNISYKNKEISVSRYFSSYPGISQKLVIRGGEEINCIIGSARLHVCAHREKRFVIAMKYEGEEDYRYLIASELTWRTEDIAKAFTQRWLIEVFIQDWKSYEGWNTLTKQRGDEGTTRSLILSLSVDHCLLFHPEQTARLNNKLPAITVGSLIEKSKADCLLSFVQGLLSSDEVEKKLEYLKESIHKVFKLFPSTKHMAGRDLGRLEPSPSLKYK